MIEEELVLLGLLKESPKHGYEIKKKIKGLLSVFAGVDLKSIYYPLQVLEQRGLVVKRKGRLGKRPERFVYELTARGHQRFAELLNKSFLDFKRPRFSLDLSLYFLRHASPRVIKRRLRARMLVLERLAKELRLMLASPQEDVAQSLHYILEHNLQMVETEERFLANLVSSLAVI
jgi:DNA-binding PadR family transcriptional regulator